MPKRIKPNIGAKMDEWVGKRIRSRRQHLGISAGNVGQQLDVQRQTVDKWENGVTRISVGQLYEIAQVLGVDPGWFFEGNPAIQVEDHHPHELDMLMQMPDATPVLLHYSHLDETQRAAVLVLMAAAGKGQPQTLDGKGKPLAALPGADGEDFTEEDAEANEGAEA